MTKYYLPLNETTIEQLALIRNELDSTMRSVHTLWCEAQRNADSTDQIDNDLDNLYSALINIMSDLNCLPSSRLYHRVQHTDEDNRDRTTTWLWVSDLQYIEVDPEALNNNAIENDRIDASTDGIY